MARMVIGYILFLVCVALSHVDTGLQNKLREEKQSEWTRPSLLLVSPVILDY